MRCSDSFPSGWVRHRRIRHSMDDLIPLREYCDREQISYRGGISRCLNRRVIAYRLQHRWYVFVKKP